MTIQLHKDSLRHMSSVAHEGKLVLVAVDDQAGLWYTVKQDGFEDSYLQTPAELRTGWESWAALGLPDEADDSSVEEQEKAELSYQDAPPPPLPPDPRLMRSLYRSAALTAVAPVQLVSALGHVYMFRQSTKGTLLVDRFVLDGLTNQLVRKLQVRYRRSRQKNQPLKSMRKGTQGMEDLDTLDFSDANGRPFFEPTTELPVVSELVNGWFAVVLVPTTESDVHRWHIFAYNGKSKHVELTTLRASDEGLFAFRDYTPYSAPGAASPAGPIAGVIRRSFALKSNGGDLVVTQGLAATRFDVQQEQATASGEMELVKTASRVMLAVPTNAGIATVNFGIAADGTLAELGEGAAIETNVRSTRREVLLPLDTLDGIKAFADASPPPTGEVKALGRSIDQRTEDLIEVQTTEQAMGTLAAGDPVKLSGTRLFDGRHRVERIDGERFDIRVEGDEALGRWEKQEAERSGLVFDGMISSFERTAEGLRITCPGHGLTSGDDVQIIGPEGIDGSYAVSQIDGNRFVINGRWPNPEAVNLKVVSRKRRGIVLDGQGAHIEIAASEALTVGLKQDFTLEAWVKVLPQVDERPFKDILSKTRDNKTFGYSYALRYLPDTKKFEAELYDGRATTRIQSSATVEDEGFHHLALVKAGETLSLFVDGELARGGMAQVDSSAVEPRQITTTDGALYLGCRLSKNNFFMGQLADVRLWKRSRNAEDVRKHMSLEVVGREAGLEGCWRLSAIAEGKVLDSSVNRNDGWVRGPAHAGATQLERKLANGGVVVKFSNSELVAVSQRSTYEESFEFRLEPPLADADAAKVFQFVHWGQASRSSEEILQAGAAAGTTEVTQLEGSPGWYVTSTRVTIPEGMALLRSFEVNVIPAKEWQTVYVRRHRLVLVSNQITRSSAERQLPFKPTTSPTANAQPMLETLASLEQQEATLLLEKRRIERSLADLSPDAQRAAQAAEERAKKGMDAAKAELDSQRENPLNYWCHIRGATEEHHKDYWAEGLVDGHTVVLAPQATAAVPESFLWKFVEVAPGKYEIACRTLLQSACTYVALSEQDVRLRLVAKSTTANPVQMWQLSTPAGLSQGVYCIVPDYDPGFVSLKRTLAPFTLVGMLRVAPESRISMPWCLWKLEKAKINEPSNTVIQERQAEYDRLADAWRRAAEAMRLRRQDKDQLNARLKAINAQLGELRGPLTVANQGCLGAIADASRSAMASETTVDVSRGLQSKLALLTSAQPASRLTALASCDGTVHLNYFDTLGRMRRTCYDAVADSRNSSHEQWLPDGPRACLEFTGNAALPVNIDIATTPGWTIEAWFWFPLPDAEWNTLARGTASHHVRVDKQGQLGIYRDGMFVAAGDFDMDSLSLGWHHLATVGLGDTTLFYIDGRRVGDTKAALARAVAAAQEVANQLAKGGSAWQAQLDSKTREFASLKSQVPFVIDPIRSLGNHLTGSEPFGKLAELRIWGIALNDDEVAANSKTALSGNEPGLLAYYPLDKESGPEVSDRSGNAKGAAKFRGAPAWWGCSAGIGQLVRRDYVDAAGGWVRQFDGAEKHVEVSYAAELNPARFTVACWARVTGGGGTWRSVITSRNVGPTRGYMLYAGQDNKWQFWVGDAANRWVVCASADAATHIVLNRWTHLAASFDGQTLTLYIDGIAAATTRANYDPSAGRPLRIGAGGTEASGIQYAFAGQVAEVCVWSRALTREEIARTVHVRQRAREPDLVACFPLDRPDPKDTPNTNDVVRGRLGTSKAASWLRDASLPIVPDALLSEEYSTVGEGRIAMMRRFMGFPVRDAALLWPDQRVEWLELKWLGNAQFAPTLLGYIEGAPPVPSENLTMADDYNGAASVELNTSEDVEFKWTRNQDSGLGASIDAFLGGGGTMSIQSDPIGISEIQTSTKVGFKGNLDFSYQFQNESSVTSSSSLATADRLELRGSPELAPKFPHLGNRFVPKNVGYALVVSALADVFVTRLARTKRMIGYQVRPVEGLLPDVNTITFMMNPAYTMNGSLDGLTGTAATSERFFKHVPQLRAEFGSLYPASYYRLREAYDLKRQIEEADKRRESYFANFDVGLVDELSMNRNIDKGDAPGAVTVPRPAAGTAPGQAADPADKAGKDFAAGADAGAEETGDAAEKRQQEIKKNIEELGKRTHASVAFAGWQAKMEDLRIRAGKRNIVNTYVWDADGGLRSESQSFANTVEHSIGGSFKLNAGLGAEAEFEAVVSVELTAKATVNLTQTMTKTASASKGLSLAVDLSGLEFRGITDYKDNPLLPGEKVDRYRFMSFYLEGSDQNFQDFFSQVVDPEWLASNDEEARALRQARNGKSNKAWRVLHRVTYVERPALMGFGRSRRAATAAETSDYQLLLDKITQLEATLGKVLGGKQP